MKIKLFDKLKEFDEEKNFTTTEKIQFYMFIFAIGAFIGWIYERLYYFWERGQWLHSGFFYGPWIPVYGVGSIVIYLIARKLKKYPIAVFGVGIVATGIVEYATGLFMMARWHKRWWDYSNAFLNLNGYICFRSLVSFAIGGLLLMYLIAPVVKHFIKHTSFKLRNIICILYSCIFIIDWIFSSIIVKTPIV